MLLRPWLNKGWLSKTGAKVSWQLLSELVSCLLPLWLMANFLPEEPFQRLVIKTTGRQSGLWEGRAVCPLAPKPWACLDWKCVGQSCSCSRYFKDHDMAGWMKSQGVVLSHAPVKKKAKNKYLISLHPACIKSWEAPSVLCFECQVDTHIHMYPYIYMYIYKSSKYPYVFMASQALPWESCFPLPSQMHEKNYPSVTTWEVVAQRREVLQSKAQILTAEQVTAPGLCQLPSLLLNQAHV